MGKKKGFGKFLAGIGLGAALGVLFAPKTGSESRKELKEYINKLINQAKEIDVEEVKDNISAKVVELQDALSDLDKEKVLKIAKQKAKDVQNLAEELTKYAVEKGTPVVKETVSNLKEKAIAVSKEVIKKLEDEKK